MAITVAQIPGALNTVSEMQSTLDNLNMLLKQAKELSDKGWQVNIGSRIPLVVTISQAQQAAMIAAYDNYKTQLVSTFQQLP